MSAPPEREDFRLHRDGLLEALDPLAGAWPSPSGSRSWSSTRVLAALPRA